MLLPHHISNLLKKYVRAIRNLLTNKIRKKGKGKKQISMRIAESIDASSRAVSISDGLGASFLCLGLYVRKLNRHLNLKKENDLSNSSI